MPGELPILGDCLRGQKGHHARVGYGYHACLHVTPIAESCFIFSIFCYMSSYRQGPQILCKYQRTAKCHLPGSNPVHNPLLPHTLAYNTSGALIPRARTALCLAGWECCLYWALLDNGSRWKALSRKRGPWRKHPTHCRPSASGPASVWCSLELPQPSARAGLFAYLLRIRKMQAGYIRLRCSTCSSFLLLGLVSTLPGPCCWSLHSA